MHLLQRQRSNRLKNTGVYITSVFLFKTCLFLPYKTFFAKSIDKRVFRCYTHIQLKLNGVLQENRFPVGDLADGVTLSGVKYDKDCITDGSPETSVVLQGPKGQGIKEYLYCLISQAKGRSDSNAVPDICREL